MERDQETGISRNRQWLYLSLIFCLNLINVMDRVNISVAAPSLMKQFSFSPAIMGLAMSAFFWSYTIFQIPAGYFMDRLGLRKGLVIIFAFWGVFTLLTGFIAGAAMLIVVRVLLGISEAGIYPSNVKFINAWFRPNQRALGMGILSAAVNIAMAGTTWMVARLVFNLGWQAAFYVTGIITLIFVPFWYGFYREKETPPPAVVKSTKSNIKLSKLITNRNIIGLTIGYFGTNYSLFFFLTWLPSYFVDKWHLNLIQSGFFTSLVFFSGAFGKPIVGWLSDLLIKRGWSITKSRKLFLVTLNVLAVSVALVAFSPSPLMASILFAIAEITGQASAAICGATAADISPRPISAQVGGIMNMSAGLGGVLAPALTGFLLAATGKNFYWPLLIAGAFMVISALSFAFILGEVKPLNYGEEREAII